MNKINLSRCEDDVIWVNSDENPIGAEFEFEKNKDETQQIITALAKFLGYDPEIVLLFDKAKKNETFLGWTEEITLIKCDDDAIWTTSDLDGIGTEFEPDEIIEEGPQMLFALAEFLGYEAESLLCFNNEKSISGCIDEKIDRAVQRQETGRNSTEQNIER